MTVLPPLLWPDPRLATPSREVRAFDAQLRRAAEDVLESMRAAGGVGPAAGHFGLDLRLFVLELPEDPAPQFFVNARIVETSAETARHDEGSISMPGARCEVTRPARALVRWQDLDGAGRQAWFDGFRAACAQHEIDQTDGVFWLQRLSRLKRDLTVKRWRKRQA
ncbi:peptide deformylase [Camelimonas abortus]|uniref:Peptide deformylase-like n=1 Tax=Camelimonas abortus TaxID=1017184 RepID=A0ABV7LB06_9HYPH